MLVGEDMMIDKDGGHNPRYPWGSEEDVLWPASELCLEHAYNERYCGELTSWQYSWASQEGMSPHSARLTEVDIGVETSFASCMLCLWRMSQI